MSIKKEKEDTKEFEAARNEFRALVTDIEKKREEV